jgi:hypothetical protein
MALLGRAIVAEMAAVQVWEMPVVAVAVVEQDRLVETPMVQAKMMAATAAPVLSVL